MSKIPESGIHHKRRGARDEHDGKHVPTSHASRFNQSKPLRLGENAGAERERGQVEERAPPQQSQEAHRGDESVETGLDRQSPKGPVDHVHARVRGKDAGQCEDGLDQRSVPEQEAVGTALLEIIGP